MNDENLAKILQDEWNNNSLKFPNTEVKNYSANNFMNKMGDPSWELIDPNPDAYALFHEFNKTFFWNKLDGVEMKWSARMTMCAGICSYEGRGGLCSVRLSKPLLQLRPRKDLLETLLHEMIHAYLFVTDNNRDRDGHGPEFHRHMNRINKQTGLNITVYHSFHDEVDYLKVHWWRCNGPCQNKKPFFGYVKRSINRAPSSTDFWWESHKANCNGTFIKIKEPLKKTKDSSKINLEKPTKTIKDTFSSPDIRQSILIARNKFLEKIETEKNIISENIVLRKLSLDSSKDSSKKPTDIKYWLCNPCHPIGSIIRVNFTSCANAIHKNNIKNHFTQGIKQSSSKINQNGSETNIKSGVDYSKDKNFTLTLDESINIVDENSLKRLHVAEDKYNFKKIKLDNSNLDLMTQKNANKDMVENIIEDVSWQNDDEMLLTALKISREEFDMHNEFNIETDFSQSNIPLNRDMSTDYETLKNDLGNIKMENLDIIYENQKIVNFVTNDALNTLENTDAVEMQELVSCPVCSREVQFNLVNQHLDSCLS